ncbi:hypothetical protein ACQ4M3_30930 [Leptolyngbya sp. AN03gr2]|uniref:hypothetical protein n=1 Tax=unclassified Leptolyngbya TaxID=2650499 RepID=UPI003D32325B
MMEIVFSPQAQKLLAEGALKYMTSKTGEILPVLVDASTNKTFEIARVVASNSLKPFLIPDALVGGILDGIQMYQTHCGFQKTFQMIGAVQQSLGVLQTTTAIVGCGVAVTGVLSAVNLYQTFQLRKDIQSLQKDLNNGFLDLKEVLTGQQAEILAHIDQQAFEYQKQKLQTAYTEFAQALRFVGFAIKCEDTIARNIHLANAVAAMNNSLAIYNAPHLMQEMNVAGRLRRAECAWTIQQMIAYVFQLQNQLDAAATCLSDLQIEMKKDSLSIVNACNSQAELDFIFPELTRIHQHDLPALGLWQTQLDIVQALPPSELKLLPNLADCVADPIQAEILEMPEEETYAELRSMSDFNSLRDQLRFMIMPELRRDYESTIGQRAKEVGYSAIAQSNLQAASDSTIANLYWYLNDRKIC